VIQEGNETSHTQSLNVIVTQCNCEGAPIKLSFNPKPCIRESIKVTEAAAPTTITRRATIP
jgi:hypothetical protein